MFRRMIQWITGRSPLEGVEQRFDGVYYGNTASPMTDEQRKHFEAAFAHMDKAFEEMEKVFDNG